MPDGTGLLVENLPERAAALITSDISKRYLCGTKFEGAALITKEQSYCITAERFFDRVKAAAADYRVMLAGDLRAQLFDILLKHNIADVYIEADYLTVSDLMVLKDGLHCARIDSSDVLSKKLSDMRLTKSDEEIKLITAAQRVNERAYERLLSTMRRGMTERQAAALLNYYIIDSGADNLAFSSVVSSGVNSASQSAISTDKPLENGDFVTIRFGTEWAGYYAVMARTVAVGQVSSAMEEAYSAVSNACIDAVQALRGGVVSKVAASVATSTLAAWGGFDKYAGTTIGFGVGLEAKESPVISLTGGALLRAGMTAFAAPGIYVPGRFGICIGDLAVITENGCSDLTNTSKRLIRL